MKPHFVYERGDFHVTFTAYCGSPAEATDTKAEIQSLCGVHLERERDLICATIDIGHLEEAIIELEKAGYSAVDGDARDFEAAHQDWDRCSEEDERD